MAVYYIDSNNGSDSNTGLLASSAWLTLSKVSAVSAGDTVLLRRGCTWRETLTVPASRVTVGAYGSGTDPKVKGSTAVAANAWSLSSGKTVTYEAALTTDPDQILAEDGTLLTLQTSTANVEANAGSYFWSSNVLYVHASDGSNPGTNGKTYEYPARAYCVNVVGKTDVIIDSLICEHGSTAGIHTQSGSDRIEIRYCTVRQNDQWGAYMTQEGTGGGIAPWIHHCVAYENKKFAGLGIRQSSGTSIVEHNLCYSNGVDSFRDHGIYAINNGTGRIEVRWNVSHNNTSAGFKASQESTDTLFHHNVSYANARFGYIADGLSTGSKWYHNVDDGSLWGFTAYTDPGSLTVTAFQDNILVNNTEYGVLKHGSNTATVTTISHNLVYNAGTARYSGIVEGASSLNANPLFENSRDYRVVASSPCVNAGVSVTGVSEATSPDIGVFERGVLEAVKLDSRFVEAQQPSVGSLALSARTPGTLT